MKQPIIISCFLLLSITMLAQKPNLSGLVIDDAEYDNLSFASEEIELNSGKKALVSQVDLSPYCPEIRHQGEISSCVGWSLGYATMTIERAIKNGWTNKKEISQQANSALFVYNQISQGNCNMGISIPKALELIQQKGNVLAQDFDHEINNCDKEVSDELLTKAVEYKIEDYIPLFKSEAEANEKIRQIKLVLAQQKPVVVGMTVLSNFYQIRAGDKTWIPTIGDQTYAGGHAMTVVGYDDNKFHSPMRKIPDEMRGAFKLMNSWGKNWGERGYIWVRYAHFADYCKQAFAVMLADEPPINFDLDQEPAPKKLVRTEESSTKELRQFSGAFGFQQYIGWGDDGPIFEEASVRLTGNHYQLQGNQQLGNRFQLYVENGFDRGYIYVFSIETTGEINVHFPRSEEYDEVFAGRKQSSLILQGGAVLTIPSENQALELRQPGKDYLVSLFSTSKIKAEYLQLLAEELASNFDHLPQTLSSILADYAVPFSDITFDTNKMGFEVSTRSEGRIVPIVLEINVE